MGDEPKLFKDRIDARVVDRIGSAFESADPSFPRAAFVRAAKKGLPKLELKARVNHIAGALESHLGDDARAAVQCAERALLPKAGEPPLTGFAAWPVVEFIGARGLLKPALGLEALRRTTHLFSAEFAVRPYIVRDSSKTLRRFERWTKDPSEHVRRLVSEGTRPRLPWGERLREFQEDPRPTLALLERLKDDPAEYVRRSVANHMNDVAKDHPELAIATLRRWQRGAGPERAWIIRRASRSLVKDGHPGALRLLGYEPGAPVKLSQLRTKPSRLNVGEDLEFAFRLSSTSRSGPTNLVIDYVIHHVKSNGRRAAKVFKLKRVALAAGQTIDVTKTHRFRQITTRKYYAGRHRLEVLVNGEVRAGVDFELGVP